MVPTKKGITVVGVEVSNFHRLKVAFARFVPGEGLVRVTGKNGSGKTSLLRSLRAALGGAGEILPQALHQGEETGSVRLELSNGFTVTRKFTEGNPKGYLTVEGPDGGKHAQGKLSEWAGPLSFDPLAFFELKPERQREILLSLGGDPELPTKLDELRRARAAKYEERTPWISKKRQAGQVARPAGERPEPIDVSAEMRRMGELQKAQRERDDLQRAAAQKDAEAVSLRRQEATVNAEIADLRARLEVLEPKAEKLYVAAVQADNAAADHRHHLESLPDPLAEMEEVRERIEAADSVRKSIEPWDRWEQARADQVEANQAVDAITAEMEGLEQREKELIASAGIPVEGLGFAPDSTPVLNGRSLAVASGAERIRLAVAVALAADPELRICLVDEANDIDLEGMEELDRLARAHGFQVWAARLGIEGPGEIVVEGGEAWARDEVPEKVPA